MARKEVKRTTKKEKNIKVNGMILSDFDKDKLEFVFEHYDEDGDVFEESVSIEEIIENFKGEEIKFSISRTKENKGLESNKAFDASAEEIAEMVGSQSDDDILSKF